MTEKATVEIGSPVSGKVLSRNGEVGDKAPVGNELVVIATQEKREAPAPAATAAPTVKPLPIMPQSAKPTPELQPAPGHKPLAAPAIRARAMALDLDLAAIEGTGPQGRILHEDLDRLLLGRNQSETRPRAMQPREGIEEIRVIGLRRQIAETMLEAKRRIPHFTYIEEVDVTALEALRKDLNSD